LVRYDIIISGSACSTVGVHSQAYDIEITEKKSKIFSMGAEFGHVGARAQQRVSHAAPGMLVVRRIFWVCGAV
jgi:hypothetical protein